MADFKVSNTVVAKRLTIPVYSAQWVPTYSSPIVPGQIQFTNFNTVSAYYTQVENIVDVRIRFTCDVSAPAAEVSGQITITPPVSHLLMPNYSVGAVTTLSQVGLFGNLTQSGQNIAATMVNAGGVINVPGAVMQLLGSYAVV